MQAASLLAAAAIRTLLVFLPLHPLLPPLPLLRCAFGPLHRP